MKLHNPYKDDKYRTNSPFLDFGMVMLLVFLLLVFVLALTLIGFKLVFMIFGVVSLAAIIYTIYFIFTGHDPLAK